MMFNFDSFDRSEWLRIISILRQYKKVPQNKAKLSFPGLKKENIRPEHIAPLACLIEDYRKKGFMVAIDRDTEVGDSLWTDYKLREYFDGGLNYTPADPDTVLNLQRVLEVEKDIYGRRVGEYLKQIFFKNKDLTPVSLSITEAYYNIFDHAQANGNAFCMLSFDEPKGELSVAICDFGIGIAKTVKQFLGKDIPDSEAIKKAMEINFSVKSASYNKGQGLANILSACTEKDALHILSNKGAIIANSQSMRGRELDFDFGGTLIAYRMSISHFEDEAIVDDFVL